MLNGLGINPEDAMYVGDGPQDVACARSVGAASGAALWSAIDPDATLEQGPSYRLHRPHQVLAAVATAKGASGSDPWVRHLPWPWRPDADNPQDDQDLGIVTADYNRAEPDSIPWTSWPMGSQWGGRTEELAQLPSEANPIAPLSLRSRLR